jgi:hypothetical protein
MVRANACCCYKREERNYNGLHNLLSKKIVTSFTKLNLQENQSQSISISKHWDFALLGIGK